jgi:hypothetical protein
MFFPLFTAFLLPCLVGCAVQTAAGLTDEQATGARTVVVCGDADDAKTVTVRVAAPEGREGRCIVMATEGDSKVWIGVRLTPVPAPLAAHIGDRGVMIANVVKDSPADKAGLQQYDVVVGFGGQEIKEPEDLTAAVGKAKPGQAVKLAIIRKGAKQELEIKPVERSGEISMDMKYPEPEESFVDDAVKLYGRAYMLGPNGEMTWHDLGALKHMPDGLKELGQSLDKLHGGLNALDRDLDIRILRDLDEKEAEDQNARVEVRVQVEKDGQTTTIVCEPDGKITVTRKAADGKQTTATYDDADALEKADPEAYELYERHDGGAESELFRVRPHGDLAREYRKEFQIDVEKKVKEALAKAEQAQAQAGTQAEQAMKEAQKKLEQARVVVRAHKGESPEAAKEILLVRVDDKGAIRVTVSQDGEKTVYKFKSKEDFKESEPDLYAQVESLLE